jgi:hypothetical protein
MRILFDHGTPGGIAKVLGGHEVTEAIERGWDRISNGALLKLAEEAGLTFCSRPTNESDTNKT